jgi:hypothetical protein
MTHDGFKQGSGCFTCMDCGKLTRHTREAHNEELCPQCQFRAEHENSHADCDFPNDDCGDKNCPIKDYTPEQRWWRREVRA